MTTKTTCQAIQRLRAELKDRFLERDREVDALLVAFIAEENVYMLGPPGTGKTALVEKAVHAIQGAKVYSVLMTPTTVPEEVLGPFSLAEMTQNDRYVRKLQGSAADSHVVYADEMYKATGAALNPLLTLANERVVKSGGVAIPCPTFTVIGTSNELPKSNDLAAFHDRFRIRLMVRPLAQRDSKMELLRRKVTGNHLAVSSTITLAQLQEAQQAVNCMPVPDSVMEALLDIDKELSDNGIRLSDRTLLADIDILRAHAILEGKDEVDEDDLDALCDTAWVEPKDQQKVAAIIGKRSNPMTAQAVKLLDAASEAWNSFPAKPSFENLQECARVNLELKQILARGKQILNGQTGSKTHRLREAIKQVAEWQKMGIEVVSRVTGLL